MLNELAQQVGKALLESENVLATAESCTGGWVAKLVTDVAGSSAWFDRGFVTYTNLAKVEMLGVENTTLETYGAVSEEAVAEMVAGALNNSSATVALSISGIAGPGGGSEEKPVGTVCFGWMVRGHDAIVTRQLFEGDRERVRQQSVEYALEELVRLVSQ